MFPTTPSPSVPSNRFDVGYSKRISFNMGQLVPTFLTEVLPGDRFNISNETLLRFDALVAPVMHEINVTVHYFFVPNRITWKNWEKFITGSTDHDHPTVFGSDQIPVSSLGDCFGINQTENGVNLPLNPFPAAAYELIFDQYYRDQNLQPGLEYPDVLIDGDNGNIANIYGTSPRRRAWNHDYFTAALPFLQKGEAVQIPFDGTVELNLSNYIAGLGVTLQDAGGNVPAGGNQNVVTNFGEIGGIGGAQFDLLNPNGTLRAIAGSDGTISNLRRAIALQQWFELNARAGTRYNEHIKAHWNTVIPDHRLMRAEYLGGSRGTVTISEVLSTAETQVGEDVTPIGSMAGHGISVSGSKNIKYRAHEHGWIMGITNVQPKTAYQGGIPRHFVKNTMYDYAIPSFAHIGEQEIKNFELYSGAPTLDELNGTFGYIPRYSEYKYRNDEVSGLFKTSQLDFWHLARQFDSTPALNSDFIECNPATRIFVDTNPVADHVLAHIYNKCDVIRKLPKFGVPKL